MYTMQYSLHSVPISKSVELCNNNEHANISILILKSWHSPTLLALIAVRNVASTAKKKKRSLYSRHHPFEVFIKSKQKAVVSEKGCSAEMLSSCFKPGLDLINTSK